MADALIFTKKRVESLQGPPAGSNQRQIYYRDAKTRGFCCAVYPTGARTFILYRKVQSRPERIFIGKWPDLSVEEARKMAEKWNGDIARGGNPAEDRRQKRQEDTFGALWQRYLKAHAERYKQPRSVAEDGANYRRYLSGWATRRLSTIARRDVEKLHAELGGRGIYTANRVLALLSTVFNKAVEWGWQGVNPCRGVKKFPEQSRERFLTQDEMPRFIKALAEEPNQDFRDFVLLALVTGARRGNVLAMRWDEIDFAGAVWRIPRTKGGKPQSIPLIKPALDVLDGRRVHATEEWVFPSSIVKGAHVLEFRRQWERLLARAEIGDLRPHDVRRTVGTWLSKAGTALPVIKAALGHADITTTAIYSRSEDAEVRKALEVTTRKMLEAGQEGTR